jgi:hypothetical protein
MRTVGITAKVQQGSCQSYDLVNPVLISSVTKEIFCGALPVHWARSAHLFLSTLSMFNECRRMPSTPLDTILG